MDCLDVRSRWSEWLDHELDADLRARLATHLEACPTCRVQAAGWRVLDADLRRLAIPDRESAARVADRVLDDLRTPPTSEVRSTAAGGSWPRLLLAAAAGFLLALLLFPPWRRGPIVELPPRIPGAETDDPIARGGAAATDLARLVVATGDIETRRPGAAEWTLVSESHPFQCAPGTEVRTGEGIRCELETASGCTIRVDQSAELAVRTPDELELRRGAVWCRAPEGASLRIVPAKVADAGSARNWSFSCPSNSIALTEVRAAGKLRVQSAGGDIELATPEFRRLVRSGEAAELVDGQLTLEPRHADALLATSWMHDLLVRRGHDSPELHQRVDRLLAHVGRSKVTNLYEDEIRSLGEYCVLPLMRFVQSPSSRNEPAQRATAMRVLADVAPPWLIADLIELLSDDDRQVRVLAAAALLRLTSHDQGRPPTDWSASPAECAPSLDAWRLWWSKHRHRYPRPIAAAPSTKKA